MADLCASGNNSPACHHTSTSSINLSGSDNLSYASSLQEFAFRHPYVLLLLLLYVTFRAATVDAPRTVGPWGPRWLAYLVSGFNSQLLTIVGRVPVVNKPPPPEEVDPEKQHVVVWHPHGAYTTMAFMHCGHISVTAKPLTWYPGIAPVLFNVPIFREMALLLNARSVSGRVVERLAAAGLSVGIQPGGIPEQLLSDHQREIAVFPPRLGFVRLAMRHGAPLLCAYIFGENQAYSTSALGRRITRVVYKLTGMPWVPVLGRWGLPWLVPLKADIHVRWGKAVDVGAPNANPTDAEVEAVYERYVAELKRVFDEHKDACLPPAVAARGLTIVKRDVSSTAKGKEAQEEEEPHDHGSSGGKDATK